ncbi:MAG TPA: ring-cleaving dioxygenase [Beijerinckiaceae bacterium]|nr:ring-cleaving dioxygenase [Beijerinckiaceae bacterium]
MMKSPGIHHISAICKDPRRNLAFYTDVLGLRLVKRTVNFDDPGTWHLYYGDELGRPGTALTFFPWPRVTQGRDGLGLAVETAFLIPQNSLSYWIGRLMEKSVAHETPEQRFGATVLPLRDHDGLRLALVADKRAGAIAGWAGGSVPEDHAIRGFAGVTLWVGDPEPSSRVLTDAFGFRAAGSEDSRHRYVVDDAALGTVVDLRATPGFLAGRMGAGTIHHVAFRAPDGDTQVAMAERVRNLGLRPTDPVDRQYFRSVYFREPGGVLLEIATDGPGFTIDESVETLGSSLRLPPWYEPHRVQIAAGLAPLD